jgi:hypothetical protein
MTFSLLFIISSFFFITFSLFFIIFSPFFLSSEKHLTPIINVENISDLLLGSLNQIRLNNNNKKTKERRDPIIFFNLGEHSLSKIGLYFPFKQKINK